MRDDEQRALTGRTQILEGLDQTCKAPQVDTGFRLVEDAQRCTACQNRRDLDALHLTARQTGIQLTADVLIGAQTDAAEQVAQFILTQFMSGCDFQQITHGQSLKAHRLLEGIGNAQTCTLGDIETRNVLAVKNNLTRGLGMQSGDELCKRCLTAAVRAGDND